MTSQSEQFNEQQRLAAFRYQMHFCPYCGNRTIINGVCTSIGWTPTGSTCGKKYPSNGREIRDMLDFFKSGV